MSPRCGAGRHGDWHSVSDVGCKSLLGPRPRRDWPSTQATIRSDTVQQPAKKVNSRRVCPEPPPPAESWNENGNAQQEEQSTRNRHPGDGAAQGTSEAGALDRNSNTDASDVNHVNHGQRVTHDGSCKIDVHGDRKPLLELGDDAFEKEMDDCSCFWKRLSKSLWRFLVYSPEFLCGFWEPLQFLVKRIGVREEATGRGLEYQPADLQGRTFRRLQWKEPTQSTVVSKRSQARVQRDFSRRSRGSSGESALTALSFFIRHGEWQCTGFDSLSGEWKPQPTLAYLPGPDPNLFQQYSICGHGGLMCANVSKSPHKEQLVVFNILTGKKKELPPLNYPRNPVLLHIWVDSVMNSYKVIAAGSASNSGEKDLSRRIEVYDSRTSEWEVGSDLRGPEYGLNEHQVGVCVNGVLYFLMFLDGDSGQKGIVAFDIEKGEWLEDRTCALPFSSFCNTLQLLESSGVLYLFSEQERDGVVEHYIHVVELWEDSDDAEKLWQLRTVVRVTISSGRGLSVYPEYTCVPFGIGKSCIFNTITREGVVYDLENGMQSRVLEAPPENQSGENFFCWNPVSFTVAPNSASKP